MALHITSTTKSSRPRPTSKQELRNIIESELERQGPDADLNFIDVSMVSDMKALFKNLRDMGHIKIDEWNVSNVENMNSMFDNCDKFNADLSHWDTSKVVDMTVMFYGCRNFSCDLSKWDVSSVTSMASMFMEHTAFHYAVNRCVNFESDLSNWDVSNVTNMSSMFCCCNTVRTACPHVVKFKADLHGWDVSSVDFCDNMFGLCINMPYELSPILSY